MQNTLTTVRRAAALAVAATLAVPAVSAFAMSSPFSHKSGKSSDESPAVVGPTEGILVFGDTIGLPLGCQLGTAAIGSGAAYLGHAQEASPVIDAANNGCDTASQQGAAGLAQMQQGTKPLNAINPYANPVLDQTADSVQQFGHDYGDEIAPFGPTVEGSGATIRFFEGK